MTQIQQALPEPRFIADAWFHEGKFLEYLDAYMKERGAKIVREQEAYTASAVAKFWNCSIVEAQAAIDKATAGLSKPSAEPPPTNDTPSDKPKLEWRIVDAATQHGGIEHRGWFIPLYVITYDAYADRAFINKPKDIPLVFRDRDGAKSHCQDHFDRSLIPPASGYKDTEQQTQ